MTTSPSYVLSHFTWARIARLMSADAKNVSRDPTLLAAVFLSILPALSYHIWSDTWESAALSAFGVEDFNRYLVPVLLLMPGFLIGWVTGFLLLEDRDDGPLLALDVTPMGKGGFIAYRAVLTACMATLVGALTCRTLLPESGPITTLAYAFIVGTEAVLSAFILPAIARNKVEGLAVTKVTNMLSVTPLLAIFDSPFRYLAAPLPGFWVGEALGLSDHAYFSSSAALTIALAVHLLVIVLLYRLILRTVG